MAHGFLSYQDTRGEVDYLGGIINAVKKYLDNREKKEKVADIVASKIEIEGQKQLTGAKEVPSIHGTKQKLLTGGSFSRLLSSPQLPGAPGSGAVNPTVMGGALANIGFAGQPLKPEGFVSDQVIDVTAKTMAYGTEEIVQAVDRLTFVNIQLLAAVRQQTALVNRDITRQRARNEENLLEKTIDSSGNNPYRRLLPAGGGSGDGTGSQNNLGLGSVLRRAAPGVQKALSQKTAKTVARTALKVRKPNPSNIKKNLVKKLGVNPKVASGVVKTAAKSTITPMKMVSDFSDQGVRVFSNVSNIKKAKALESAFNSPSAPVPAQIAAAADSGVPIDVIAKSIPETAVSKAVTKSTQTGFKAWSKTVGKSALKKIPLIAGLAGIAFGIQRAMEGDFLGAGLEITSGLLGATGVGAGASMAIDGFLIGRDLGAVPFAKGGIITRPTLGMVGETGQAEGVFPLQGREGKKTFEMFGNAFIDAQKRRKKEVAEIQSLGLEKFATKKGTGLFSFLFGGGNNENNSGGNNSGGNAWWDPLGLFNGGGNPQTPPLVPPPPLPSSPGGNRIQALRNFIGRKESGNNYSKLVGGVVDPSILSKSVAQLTKERGGLFAMGRYQIQMNTANDMLRQRGIDPTTFMFDQAGQDSIFNMLLERRRYGDFLSGRISKEQFGKNLALEWAALPYSENNRGAYDGINGNRSLYKWNDSMKFLEGLKNMGDQSSNINSTSMQTAMASMPGTTVINNTYVTGDAKSSGGNAPAAVPIGIGSRDTGTSAFSDLSIRTLV